MKKYKRGLAFLLTLMLVLTFIPVPTALALNNGETKDFKVTLFNYDQKTMNEAARALTPKPADNNILAFVGGNSTESPQISNSNLGTHSNYADATKYNVYTGLVNPTLTNGNVTYRSPIRALDFFQTNSNKYTSYTNVAFPFTYNNGYFEFDSAVNRATFNKDINNPRIDTGSQNGGFWPFGNISGTTKDYHFGMTMEVDFYVPSDIKVNGKEMVFSFRGDDDVWVFVDDKLVLDMGGRHQPTEGTINFTKDKINNPTGRHTSSLSTPSTTLSEIFGAGYFQSFSIHKLKVFYVERGGGDSNFHMTFNTPPVEPLTVEKRVDNTGSITPDTDFNFIIQTGKNDSNLSAYSNKAYDVQASNGAFLRSGTTKSTGGFTLKAGEKAVFRDFDEGDWFKVHEVAGESIVGNTWVIPSTPTLSQNSTGVGVDNYVKGKFTYGAAAGAYAIQCKNNVLTTDVSFDKLDSRVNGAVPGAVFTLTGVTGATGSAVTSSGINGSVVFKNVPAGTYHLRETTVPVGYSGTDKTYVVIVSKPTGQNQLTSRIMDGTDEITSIYNNPDLTTVMVKITKAVGGPVTAVPRTFEFGLYHRLQPDGKPYVEDEPITTASITVTGKSETSVTIPLALYDADFTSNSLTLFAAELSTPAGEADAAHWHYDTWHPVTVTKGAQTPSEVRFENTYAPKGLLTVHKVWTSVDDREVVTGGAIEYRLLKMNSEGKWVPADEPASTRTLCSDNNWTDTIPELDLNTVYSVQEITNDSLHDYVIGYQPPTIQFTDTELTQQINIINAYRTPTGQITIIKMWDDESDAAGDRPKSISFAYTDPNGKKDTVNFGADDNAKDNDPNIWTYTMAPTTVFGEYTFKELPIRDYYAATTEQAVTITKEAIDGSYDGRNNSLTFSNTYVPPTGIITVIKEWMSESAAEKAEYRPSSITMTLKKLIIGEDVDPDDPSNWTNVDGVEPLTLTAGNASGEYWIGTFRNLTEWGTYKVVESQVSDYTTSYSAITTISKDGSRTGEQHVYNTFDHPTGSITVNKIWIDDETTSEIRPEEITVKLYKTGESSEPTLVSSAALTGGAYPETTWSVTFDQLALDGSTYTVEESAVNNYAATTTYGGVAAVGEGLVLDKEHRTGTADITNTYAKGTITVIKNWEHGTVPAKYKGFDAVITLKKTYPEIITEETIERDEFGNEYPSTTTSWGIGTSTESRPISGSDDGSVIFYNLEIGEGIEYEILEDSAYLFYDVEYSARKVVLSEENPNGLITITNSYVEPKGELTVTKEWGENFDPNRPDEITVELIAFGGSDALKTVTISDEDNWTYTFDELTLGGIYTVREKAVGGVPLDESNYIASYEGNDLMQNVDQELRYVPDIDDIADGDYGCLTITNNYTSETGSLTVNKRWEGMTGSSIEVTVTRYIDDVLDEEWHAAATLGAINDWTSTFENLPLYGKDGIYKYNVDESGDLALYTQKLDDENPLPRDITLNANETVEVNIVNVYTPDKGQLTITKEWRGVNETPNITISAILIEMGREDVGGVPLLLGPGNQWTQTIGNLDVTKTYRLVETKLEEYSPSYDYGAGAEAITFSSDFTAEATIINTRENDTPLLTLKKVIYNPSIILDDDGNATFRYGLEVKNNGNRTMTEIYVLDEMTASVDGADFLYSTGAAIGKQVKIDIAGRLSPGDSTLVYYNVTVDKTGAYDNTATVYGKYGGETISFEPVNARGVVKDPGLTIEKEVVGATTKYGDGAEFTFRLIVKNDGILPLKDVKITDAMTSSVSGATMKYSYTGSEFDEATKIFTLGEIENDGSKVVLQYSVAVDKQGTYKNTATVSGVYVIEDESGQKPTEGTVSDEASASVKVDPIIPNDDDDDDDNGGGGGGSTPTPTTPIDDEAVPQGPVPDVIKEETIINDAIPAGPLPKTGGVAPIFFFGAGALLAGGGLFLRRKSKTNLAEKHIEE